MLVNMVPYEIMKNGLVGFVIELVTEEAARGTGVSAIARSQSLEGPRHT